LIGAVDSGSLAQEPHQPTATADEQQPATERHKSDDARITPTTKDAQNREIIDTKEVAKDEQPKPPKYRSPCGDTDDDRQADLCEQKRMSAAAERAADYAWWQLWVGGVGLGFIIASVAFAGIAAFGARNAANAAAEQVRIMRRADRPYLMPRDPELRNFPDARSGDAVASALQIRFSIENLGKGIAFLDGYGIAHEVCQAGRQGNENLTIRSEFARLPITSGGLWSAEAAFDIFGLSQDQTSKVVSGEHTLFVYGSLHYSDIYGVFRHTGFMFSYSLNVRDAEKSFLVMIPNHVWWHDIEEVAEKNGGPKAKRAEHPALLPTWPPP
jgi:hypothetical protein